jgi:hypothetical protein
MFFEQISWADKARSASGRPQRWMQSIPSAWGAELLQEKFTKTTKYF